VSLLLKDIGTKVLGIFCYITVILYLISHFIPYSWIISFYSSIAALLLIAAIVRISPMNRIIVSTLVMIGTTIFIYEQVHMTEIINGFGENIGLLALFLLIPMISTFMSTAGYLTVLKENIKQREKKGGKHPYRLSYILVASIGTILNFGALALVKRIADESFSTFQERKLTLHMMRAFAFCMLWSPYFVNVGLVLLLFDVSWFDIGGFGFLIAIIYMLISIWMLPHISFSDDPPLRKESGATDIASNHSSLKPLISYATVIILLSLSLDYVLSVNMLIIVSMLAVVLPLIWAIFSKLLKPYSQDVWEQVLDSFPKFKNELAIFVSAGYFGVALTYTNLGEVLSSLLFSFSLGTVYLFTLLVVVITILLAQVGIHPIIIVIGVGSAITPETFGVSPEYIALTFLLSWTLATQVSPFSGQVLLSSKLMKTSATLITRENMRFVSLCFLILPLVLYSFHIFGWL